MQLQYLSLSSNRLEGGLPETWSSLTSVSHVIEIVDGAGAGACSRYPHMTASC